jgi:hypothetical protein
MPLQKRASRKRQARKPPTNNQAESSVFLNIPYDTAFEPLYLAYIAAISSFGFAPRAAIEVPGGARRLDRIFALIRSCEYSVHDLSRVQLDPSTPRVPRFNMPFELGLTVAWANREHARHDWFVCEAQPYRLQKSLSDLNGTDPYIHHGTVRGLFGQLCNAFVRAHRQPTVAQMMTIHRKLRSALPSLLHEAGAHSPFTARVFTDLCVVASAAADIEVR